MQVTAERAVLCPCCTSRCLRVLVGHPGYRAGTTFDIYRCASCDASQAHPLVVDPGIYEDIYRNIENVPAYERYAGYERAALDSNAPLDWLAEAEDVYWAIRKVLQERSRAGGRLRLLDAGSGLGYLTHALNRAGYDARGIDVSEAAVARANATFGEYFEVADVTRYADEHRGAFDAIVMTEVIEHVADVHELLSAALDALAPSGALLVTTPNKSSFAADAIWATENPPVHLWWFSENALRALGERLGCSVAFVDFTEFNRLHAGANGFVDHRRQRHVPFFPVTLNQDGSVSPTALAPGPRRKARIALDYIGLDDTALAVRHRLSVKRRGIPPRRGNMCAVLTKRS